VIGGASTVGVTEAHFDWISLTSNVQRQTAFFDAAFSIINIVGPTLIIMVSYTKVFLVVRRQVRSIPTDVLGSFGSRTIFGSSMRAAKNLFLICVAYYVTYMPVLLRAMLKTRGIMLPGAIQFVITWIFHSSAAVNGFLYMALHSSVRRELRRYLPCCRRFTVTPASFTQPVGDAGARRQRGCVDTEGATPGAPVPLMTSSLNT